MIHSDLHSNRKCAFRILDNLFFFCVSFSLLFPSRRWFWADFRKYFLPTFHHSLPRKWLTKIELISLGTLKNAFIKIVTEAFIRDLYDTWKAICFSLFTVFIIQAEETARNLETLSWKMTGDSRVKWERSLVDK